MEEIRQAPLVSYDAEANGLEVFADYYRVAGICIAVNVTTGYYIPIHHETPDSAFTKGIFKKLGKIPFILFRKDYVANRLAEAGFTSKPIIGHNIKYDLHVLRHLGVKHTGPVYDTLLFAQVENNYRENGLKELAGSIFGYEVEEMDWTKLSNGFCDTDPRVSYTYAAADPVNTLRLAYYQVNEIESTQILRICQTIEFPLVPKIAEIEAFGVELDIPKLQDYAKLIEPHLAELQREIRKAVKIDVNPGSPDEKFNLLYRHLRVPTLDGREPDRTGGTDSEALDNILSAIKQLEEKLPNKLTELEQFLDGRQGGFQSTLNEVLELALISRVNIPRLNEYQWGTATNVRKLIATMRTLLESLPQKKLVTQMIRSWGKLSKLLGSFVAKMPRMAEETADRRIHTEFKQILNSGRQAGKNPNLMQLPRDDEYEINYPNRTEKINIDVRDCILPPPGFKFVTADYDAMELRMAAALSGCGVMKELSTGVDANGRPYDPHIKTAHLMGMLEGLTYEEALIIHKSKDHEKKSFVKAKRQDAKPIGFAVLYGGTEHAIAGALKCSLQKAADLLQLWLDTFWGVRDWIMQVREQARDQGYIDNDLGRRRWIPKDAYDSPHLLDHYVRACQNHTIQSLCAEIAKFSEVQLADALEGREGAICNFIHDELITAVKDDPEQIGFAGAALEGCMTKQYKDILFTAKAEVKDTLSKSAKDLSETVAGFGDPRFAKAVEQQLHLNREELLQLPW